LWVAAGLSAPLVIIAMTGMFTATFAAASWIEFGLAVPVCTWAAWPFYVRAAASLRSGHLNMFTLIGLGVGAAFGFSGAATSAPGIFPLSARAADGRVDVYFEAAAVIVTLILVGQVLELRARRRTGDAIRKLVALAPTIARRVMPDGSEGDVPLEAVV